MQVSCWSSGSPLRAARQQHARADAPEHMASTLTCAVTIKARTLAGASVIHSAAGSGCFSHIAPRRARRRRRRLRRLWRGGSCARARHPSRRGWGVVAHEEAKWLPTGNRYLPVRPPFLRVAGRPPCAHVKHVDRLYSRHTRCAANGAARWRRLCPNRRVFYRCVGGSGCCSSCWRNRCAPPVTHVGGCVRLPRSQGAREDTCVGPCFRHYPARTKAKARLRRPHSGVGMAQRPALVWLRGVRCLGVSRREAAGA